MTVEFVTTLPGTVLGDTQVEVTATVCDGSADIESLRAGGLTLDPDYLTDRTLESLEAQAIDHVADADRCARCHADEED